MSETTNTPGPDDEQGTFVGGSFGHQGTEDATATAERLEAQEAAGLELAGGVEDLAPGTTGGGVEDIAEGSTGGVEDVVAQPSPGERNEPV